MVLEMIMVCWANMFVSRIIEDLLGAVWKALRILIIMVAVLLNV